MTTNRGKGMVASVLPGWSAARGAGSDAFLNRIYGNTWNGTLLVSVPLGVVTVT